MLYTKEQREGLEEIIRAFEDYLKGSQYLDLVWSDKVGYVLLKISAERRQLEGESFIIEDCSVFCQELFSEIVMDVLQETGSGHSSCAVDMLEAAEIARRFQPYLDSLPQYREIAKSCYGVKGLELAQ